MLILIALALFFLLTIAIAVLSWRRETALPHPYYLGGGMLVVMILFGLGRPRQPLLLPLIRWQVADIIPVQPTFLIDDQSWVLSLALLAVAVAFVLNTRNVDRQSVWILGLTSAGLLGTLSGNALSLLFSWTLIDLLQFGYQVQHRPSHVAPDHFVLSFSYRLAAPILLAYGSFQSLRLGIPLTFQVFSSRVEWILFAAAIVRIATSLPLASPHNSKTARGRHLVFSQSISAAVSLLLLSRVAEGGLAPPGMGQLRLWLALVLPLFSLGWITAPDLFSGGRSWMLGWLSLVSLAVVGGHGEATLAWGLTWLLSGNILFLVPESAGLKKYIALVFFLGAGGLPFTPLWMGMILGGHPLCPGGRGSWYGAWKWLPGATGGRSGLSGVGPRVSHLSGWLVSGKYLLRFLGLGCSCSLWGSYPRYIVEGQLDTWPMALRG